MNRLPLIFAGFLALSLVFGLVVMTGGDRGELIGGVGLMVNVVIFTWLIDRWNLWR